MGWFDFLGTDPVLDEQQKARVWATQNGVRDPGANVVQMYRDAMGKQADHTAYMGDMAQETKAFTSTDPATRATAPGAGAIAPDAGEQFGPTLGQLGLGTPQEQAAGAAWTTKNRLGALYDDVGAMKSGLTPEMIAGLQHNGFNSPQMDANGQSRGALDAQNGGGHMGGYGSAVDSAIRAGADVQAQANGNQLAADIGKYQDSFNTQKQGLLHSIATSDPSFANAITLGNQQQSLKQFDADQAHYAQDRQDRMDMARDQNVSAGTSGLMNFAGGLLANPTASATVGGAIGSIGGPVGTAIGSGVGYLSGLLGQSFGGQHGNLPVETPQQAGMAGKYGSYGTSTAGPPDPAYNPATANAPFTQASSTGYTPQAKAKQRAGAGGAFTRGW